jgi:putative serine protease PepD
LDRPTEPLRHPPSARPPDAWPGWPPDPGAWPFPPAGPAATPAPALPSRRPARRGGPPGVAWVAAIALLSGLAGGAVGVTLAGGRVEPRVAEPTPVASQVVTPGRVTVDRVQAVASALLPAVVQIETRTGSSRATGSGVIMRRDGYMLTNNHVVAGADRILVTLPSAERLKARLIGRDPASDLAVIKVQRTGLPVATFGRSADLRVGELAVAVGSPFGLQGSVTTGIVSALHRVVQVPGGPSRDQDLVDAIQTDAAINPGNSGGALANARGQVVGINTAIATNGEIEANAGVGFAVPIDEALEVARQLIAGRKVRVPFLGVQAVADLSPEVAEQYQLRGRTGALVQTVLSGSPADLAGLRGGDLVVRVNHRSVRGWDELKVAVRQVQVGQTIPIVVVRGGREVTLNITPTDQSTSR